VKDKWEARLQFGTVSLLQAMMITDFKTTSTNPTVSHAIAARSAGTSTP